MFWTARFCSRCNFCVILKGRPTQSILYCSRPNRRWPLHEQLWSWYVYSGMAIDGGLAQGNQRQWCFKVLSNKLCTAFWDTVGCFLDLRTNSLQYLSFFRVQHVEARTQHLGTLLDFVVRERWRWISSACWEIEQDGKRLNVVGGVDVQGLKSIGRVWK